MKCFFFFSFDTEDSLTNNPALSYQGTLEASIHLTAYNVRNMMLITINVYIKYEQRQTNCIHRIEMWRTAQFYCVEFTETRLVSLRTITFCVYICIVAKIKILTCYKSMASHCCVVGFTRRGYAAKDRKKCHFLTYPQKNTKKRKQWIHAVRRDEAKLH